MEKKNKKTEGQENDCQPAENDNLVEWETENELSLIEKAHDWFFSGKRPVEGMEIFRTQKEGQFVLVDTKTDAKIVMFMDTQLDGVITRLSFAKYAPQKSEEDEKKPE
jgi:predicted component of viral defense system (DUF524 family)